MSAPSNQNLDRELNLRAIVGFGVGLAITMVVAAVLMWLTSGFLKSRIAASDPPLPTLPEARVQPEPPEPRLQTDPEEELQALRAEEIRLLSTFAWLDESRGVARIPIDKAIEILTSEAQSLQENEPRNGS